MKKIILFILLCVTQFAFGQIQPPQLLRGTAHGNISLVDSTKMLGFGVDTSDYGFRQNNGEMQYRGRGQQWQNLPDSMRSVNNSFYSVDLNGTDEYAYRTYAASDSFLNMNGYERTLLPQSTMKIALAYNGGKDSVNTFTSATDTTAGASRAWNSYASASSSITGGKFQIVTVSGAVSGIVWASSLTVGKKYYVKVKTKVASGTPSEQYVGAGTDAGTCYRFTPNTEEKIFEGTFLATSTSLYIYAAGTASGETTQYDDIEVREVTNSVTNGTFASGTGWDLALSGAGNWTIPSDVQKLRATNVQTTNIAYCSQATAGLGKRYVITYQIDSISSGGSFFVSRGATVGTTRTATGVYSDTLTSPSTATDYAIAFRTTVNGTYGTIDNVHLYEIPSYFAQSTTTNSHSVGWSRIDYLPGAGDTTSLRIISSAAGDSVHTSVVGGNNIKLVSSANTFHSIVAGNKYTLELWARSKKVGTRLYTSNFATTDSWTAQTGSTIAASSFALNLTKGTNDSVYAIKSISSLTNGRYARIKLIAKSDSSTGVLKATTVGNFSTPVTYINNPALTTSYQYYEFIARLTSTTMNLYIGSSDFAAFDIDSCSVDTITQTMLYINPKGTAAKLSDTLSIIPGVFEKVVYNFTAVANCDTLKFWLNQADTVYVDSVNLQQMYDVVQNYWVYPRSTSGIIVSKTNSITSATGIGWKLSVVGGVAYYVTQGAAFADSISFGTLNQNNWNLLTLVRREDSTITFLNGVRTTKSARIKGNINNSSNFTLGGLTGGSNLFNGLIGEVQYLRFSNIYLSDYNTLTSPLTVYNAYTLGRGFTNVWSGGTPKAMIWYDWLGDDETNFFHDLSGNNYNLTGVNATRANSQSRWKR